MNGRTQTVNAGAPEWVTAEMPPGYHTRLLEIERLSADLQAMDAVGRVLWETGEPLRDGVATAFGAMKCDVDGALGPAGSVVVNLGDSNRLLLVVSGATIPIQKAHEELTRAFQAAQFAAKGDRVVLVANNDPGTPPSERADPIIPDALDLLQRTGVVLVTTATVFRLWRLWLEDPQKARKALDRLHAQDGGLFVVPSR